MINLTQGAIPIANTNLTIDGAKLGISIDRNNNGRIFNITGSSNVTINNLELEYGKAPATDPLGEGSGGAIFDSAGSLSLYNDTFF